uniref:Uncharacterized protein n=1 Tax=Meloidogyne hapla TaxID=6305 RepID=A0A1I8B0M9_MELHA
MRRGFEDERLMRKRFSASLMGIRGIKNNCKSNGNSSERSLKSTGKKSGDITTISSNNKIQYPSSSSARSASWCAEVSAEQMQKMKISSSGGDDSQEEGLTINSNSRICWSVSSIDGVTEIFYTPKNVPSNVPTLDGDEDKEIIPGPALTAIKLLLDSATTSGDEHLIQDEGKISYTFK